MDRFKEVPHVHLNEPLGTDVAFNCVDQVTILDESETRAMEGHDLQDILGDPSLHPHQAWLDRVRFGVSRMSAVVLYEKIARDDLSKEDCQAWVAEREAQFEGMDIPTIILREILEKLLPESGEQATTSE